MKSKITSLIIVAVMVVAIVFFIIPTGGTGSTTTTTTSTTSTTTTLSGMAESGTEVCTTTETVNTSGEKSSDDSCSPLYFLGLSSYISGEKLYDSKTGESGQISKTVTFTMAPSKPVKQTMLSVGVDAYIGTTKVASNNTLVRFDGVPNGAKVLSLTLTGLKLESYSHLFANGGTLSYTVSGNRSFTFMDGTYLFEKFVGNAGNSSLTFQASSPTVTNTDECGGCNLNPTGSAYTVPLAGATSLTVKVVCNADVCSLPTAWAPAAGGTISASYLCWDASKLTQPCSISPPSFSGILNSNSEYSFTITSVTVGSFDGFYWNGAAVVCCAPMYAPVGYVGAIALASPFAAWGTNNVKTSLPIQFVVASSPTSQVGGIVYISPPCDWFASPKACFNA